MAPDNTGNSESIDDGKLLHPVWGDTCTCHREWEIGTPGIGDGVEANNNTVIYYVMLVLHFLCNNSTGSTVIFYVTIVLYFMSW